MTRDQLSSGRGRRQSPARMAGHARPLNRATVAAAADSAGTGPHQMCVTVNINDMVSPKILRSAQGAKAQAYKRSSSRRQADQPRAKGSSCKPEFTSSRIRAPGYKRTSPRSRVQATRIKVFSVCFTWKLIWWGEKRILLPDVTFNSRVKKDPLGA